jgi:hypothetical protein
VSGARPTPAEGLRPAGRCQGSAFGDACGKFSPTATLPCGGNGRSKKLRGFFCPQRTGASAENHPPAGHSRESGNPLASGLRWTRALRQAQGKLCAGVTKAVVFVSLGGTQAHDH